MTNAPVAIDRLQTLEIRLQFAAQVALDRQFASRDCLDDLVELLAAQIFRAQIGINVGLVEDLFSGARANAVNVGKRRFDALVAGNFNA